MGQGFVFQKLECRFSRRGFSTSLDGKRNSYHLPFAVVMPPKKLRKPKTEGTWACLSESDEDEQEPMNSFFLPAGLKRLNPKAASTSRSTAKITAGGDSGGTKSGSKPGTTKVICVPVKHATHVHTYTRTHTHSLTHSHTHTHQSTS